MWDWVCEMFILPHRIDCLTQSGALSSLLDSLTRSRALDFLPNSNRRAIPAGGTRGRRGDSGAEAIPAGGTGGRRGNSSAEVRTRAVRRPELGGGLPDSCSRRAALERSSAMRTPAAAGRNSPVAARARRPRGAHPRRRT
jgi:hypothetical protein